MRCRAAVPLCLLALTAGCGGAGTDDEPIRYPPAATLPAQANALPAWVPERYAADVEYRPDLSGRCHVLVRDQQLGDVPPGRCRTAVAVADTFARRFGATAICDQDSCPPRTHRVLGWGCRLTSFFDDDYTITCRRGGETIAFGGGA